MALTVEQVLALAPDPQVASAGRSLASTGKWGGLGRSDRALWGECTGSAVYKVKADGSDWTTNCSCPSRKFPCKHGIGLLLLAAGKPAEFAAGEPPGWVTEWLAKRDKRAAGQADDSAGTKTKAPRKVSVETQAKREQSVTEGVEALNQWLDDLIAQGLGHATEVRKQLAGRAKRLIDAKAPGLAAVLTQISQQLQSPGRDLEWLAGELGRVAMIADAWGRIGSLPEPMQCDLRAAVGIPTPEAEVRERGERVRDRWVAFAHVRDQIPGPVREHRVWLHGLDTGRQALLLQYVPESESPTVKILVPGVHEAELAFYPSAHPQRAVIAGETRLCGEWVPSGAKEMGTPRAAELLAPAANSVIGARRTWDVGDWGTMLPRWHEAVHVFPLRQRIGGVLTPVVPTEVAADSGHCVLRDRDGLGVPCVTEAPELLLALSGGWPIATTGEWDGERFRLAGAFCEGQYTALTEAAQAMPASG